MTLFYQNWTKSTTIIIISFNLFKQLITSAAEVREYVSSSIKSVENRSLRKQKVNLSTIREKYRQARFNERYKKRIKQQYNESFLEMEISHLRKVKK